MIPFGAYIGQETSVSQATSQTIENFFILPFEIQLAIFKECDPQTLFSLMRTSSVVRSIAEEVFWSHPTPWYYTSCNWLLGEYGCPGPEPHCLYFSRSVQQVEVEIWMLGRFQLNPEPNTSPPELSRPYVVSKEAQLSNDQARKFWKSFKYAFPTAKRVVLSDDDNALLPFAFPKVFEAVILMCPPEIKPYVSLWQLNNRGKRGSGGRNLYTLCRRPDVQWKLVQKNWTRTRVMIPPQWFSGLIGAFQQHRWWINILVHRHHAVRYMRFQAYEDFHFDRPEHIVLSCPHPRCSATFTKKGDWTDHAKLKWHDRHNNIRIRNKRNVKSKYLNCDTIPDEIELPLIDLEIDSVLQCKKLLPHLLDLKELCGKVGNGKERKFDEDFIHLLDNDPLYRRQCPAEKCKAFLRFYNAVREDGS
jgi:hypothetical protein